MQVGLSVFFILLFKSTVLYLIELEKYKDMFMQVLSSGGMNHIQIKRYVRYPSAEKIIHSLKPVTMWMDVHSRPKW